MCIRMLRLLGAVAMVVAIVAGAAVLTAQQVTAPTANNTEAAIKAAGNYGETWERHLGSKTPLGMARGQSALVKDGGLLYAVPFR